MIVPGHPFVTIAATEQKLVTNVAVPVPAPVVATASKVSLADHLDLRNLPLATTPGGRTFAIKSLHPADSEIKCARGPGGIVPSVAISYDAVDTIPFPVGAVKALFLQTPNPIYPASLVFFDATNTYIDHYLWQNAAVGGLGLLHQPANATQLLDPLSQFRINIDKYRVTAQSITCDVIAPAVADQGTILSAQWVDAPATLQPSCFDVTSGNPGTIPSKITFMCDWWLYHTLPTADKYLMATSAYSSKAREGFYQPLKIDKFKFVSSDDGVWFGTDSSEQEVANELPTLLGNYPIWFNHFDPSHATLKPLLKPSGHIVGGTWIEGTAGNPNVSLRVRVRQNMEVIPVLGKLYAPLAEAPLPPDELCYKMIREISGRMKDGYPASYNDLGKLKDTILKIGKSVLKYADPVLDVMSVIPGVGPIASGAKLATQFASGLAKIGSKSRKPKVITDFPAPPSYPAPNPPGQGKKRRKRKGKSKKQAK